MGNALDALATLALSKTTTTAKVKDAKGEVAVGTHKVNCLVRVQGDITLGEEYEQEFWQISKPERTVLALVCAMNGTTADKITQEQYDRILDDVEGRFHEISDKEAARFKSDRVKTIKKLREPTLQMAAGKLTGKVKAEIVEEVEV